jgi:hypothetical protein
MFCLALFFRYFALPLILSFFVQVSIVDLSNLKLLVYVFAALSIVVLICWLGFEKRLAWIGNYLSGVFWATSIGALLIGIIIFPLTLIGLLVVIGIFGLIPFFTAFVYLRNGIRAFKSAPKKLAYSKAFTAILVGAICISGFPLGLQLTVNSMFDKSLAEILSGQSTLLAISRLKSIKWFVNEDRFVWLYQNEKDPTRRANLANAYFSLTDKDIQQRLHRLSD